MKRSGLPKAIQIAPAALLALSMLGVPLASSAAVYRYVDDRGVIHFTDLPADARYEHVSTAPDDVRLRQKQRRSLKPPPPENAFDSLILISAREHQVEPALVKAVIAAESNFKPLAVSRVGAQGLMQLMPATAASLGVENAFHPRQNVDGGTRYLRAMLDRYGDVRRALAAYNAGPSAVDRYKGIPPYRETKQYVLRVLHYYRGYHAAFHQQWREMQAVPAKQGPGGQR
jgi:soluble lytic murein transglycosylase-like protein